MNRLSFLLTITGGLLAAALPLRAEAAALDLAPVQAWVANAAKVKTLIADFRQERVLRTMKQPLVTTGKLWYSQPANAFRWQTGDPAKLIAILKPGREELTVARTEKKEAEVIGKAALQKDRMGQGLSLMQAGFPSSLEEFQKRFTILAIIPESNWHRVELKPAVTMGGAVVKVMLMLNATTHKLDAMHVYFRDGSRISSIFTSMKENAAIPAAQFSMDLTGYTVKRK